MRKFKMALLALLLIGLIAPAGCGPKAVRVHFEEPLIPAEPNLKVEPMKHPLTGKPGEWFSLEDAGADLDYRADLKAAAQKGLINTQEANRLFEQKGWR